MLPVQMFDAARVGSLLKEWREMNGLSLYILAKAYHTRIEVLRRIEEGKGTMASLLGYITIVKHQDNRRDARTLYEAIWDTL